MERIIGFISSVLLILFYYLYYKNDEMSTSEDIGLSITVFTPFVYYVGLFLVKKIKKKN